ncbi:hypothetical protein ACFQMA_04180 [Halosimplex aquaticum]|uniref:Glutamine amidotransferase type-2 domain-containing protein n=1 Tax=Halosimplex aquaticum TaxID=3026162 RepID=A0ABD5XVE1_9EURY|nr:hypothetical protein [Halosimplex aquaticum]
MTGLIGTTAGDERLGKLADRSHREDWYELDRVVDGEAAAGVLEHGSRDPDANVVWRGDGLIGVVYGVVSNRDRLSLSWGELFRGVVDDSRNVLARLDGPFALACLDADAGEVHLATDVAGSRPIYYAVGDGGDDEAGDGIDFASEVGPLLTAVDDPSLDPEAVSDLLLAGGVLGERTLVDGVASLPPATHLVFDGTVSTRRYWAPESAGLAPSGYPDRWLGAYRQALGDVAATTGDPSLWFPGDPGSRVAAAVLAERGCPVETLTCGGPDGGDRESASQVAAYLGLPNRQVHDDPDRHLVDAVADAVDATDAMVNWAAVDGLPYVTDRLHTDADALVFGRPHLDALSWAGTVCADDSPVDAVAENECVLPPAAVRTLLSTDRDPVASIRDLVSASVDGPTERTAVDAALQVRAATEGRSRAVQRSRVGTRTVASRALLDTAARMPACYRLGTRWLSDSTRGDDPPIDRAVVRRLDSNLAQIPDRTEGRGRSGSSGLRADGAGGLDARASDGDAYVRRYASDDRFRRFVDDLLERVGDRDPLNGDAVAALHDRLAAGDLASFTPVAALTGLELWAGRYLDGETTATAIEV